MSGNATREKLVQSAYRIIAEGSLSQLTVDNIVDGAKLSPRTFFTHFRSKDELLVEVLKGLRSANLAMLQRWAAELGWGLSTEQRILSIFQKVIAMINSPEWKGCCFTRLSAEFHDLRGHPVHAVVAEAKRDMERWLEAELRKGQYEEPDRVAKQLGTLLNGLLVMQLVHGTPDYGEEILCMLPELLSARRVSHLHTSPTRVSGSPNQQLARQFDSASSG